MLDNLITLINFNKAFTFFFLKKVISYEDNPVTSYENLFENRLIKK